MDAEAKQVRKNNSETIVTKVTLSSATASLFFCCKCSENRGQNHLVFRGVTIAEKACIHAGLRFYLQQVIFGGFLVANLLQNTTD
jgi:hypothetical protein